MPRDAFLLALGLLLHVPAAAAPPVAPAPVAHALHGGPDFGGDPPRFFSEEAALFWRFLTQ